MDILAHPNPALKQTAHPVDPKADKTLKKLVDGMAKAMYDAPGVGLAAGVGDAVGAAHGLVDGAGDRAGNRSSTGTGDRTGNRNGDGSAMSMNRL